MFIISLCVSRTLKIFHIALSMLIGFIFDYHLAHCLSGRANSVHPPRLCRKSTPRGSPVKRGRLTERSVRNNEGPCGPLATARADKNAPIELYSYSNGRRCGRKTRSRRWSHGSISLLFHELLWIRVARRACSAAEEDVTLSRCISKTLHFISLCLSVCHCLCLCLSLSLSLDRVQ